MKTEKIMWGMILIFIGAIFLLNNFGVIDFYWGSVWRFWPVIFILTGANMIFSRFNNVTGTALSAGLTFIALIFLGYQGTRPNTNNVGRSWFRFDHREKNADRDQSNWKTSNTFTEEYSANALRAELNIQGGATSYRLDGLTSNLFDAEVRQSNGMYTLEKTTRDSVEVLSFRMKDKKNWRMDDMEGNEVKIKLNSNPIWNINFEVGAGETTFDLSKYKVESLKLKGGVASYEFKLPEPIAIMNVTADTGVADVNIKVPKGSACRITIDSGLSSRDFSGFEKQADGTYETSNYGSSVKKININLKGGLSNFEVSRY